MTAARSRPRRERSTEDTVTAADVGPALRSVLASAAFAHSPSLTAFLRFVVEAALAGRGDQLKGYTIAVEALGRRSDFDPETDAIVRVDAGRIRSALARYYETDGAHDAVVIDLPRGHYAPTFSRWAQPSTVPPATVEAPLPIHSEWLRSRAAAQTCRLLLHRMASGHAALRAEIDSVRETIAHARKLVASPDRVRVDDRIRVERSI
jgi:hypothetical protein